MPVVLDSQSFVARVSGSSRLPTVSKWWTLQKVFVVRHSRGFSVYAVWHPAGMFVMVVQAGGRPVGILLEPASQDSAADIQALELRCIRGALSPLWHPL